MSHSLIGADARTHCKIVALALGGGVGLAVLAGGRAEPDASSRRAGAEHAFAGTTARGVASAARRGDGLAKMRQDVVSRTRAAPGSADAS